MCIGYDGEPANHPEVMVKIGHFPSECWRFAGRNDLCRIGRNQNYRLQ